MATVTKSIGATGRDYSTVTAWEAASYGATASDDAIGEMYDDAAFDESVTINDTTPLSVTLRAAAADEHDGTAGSGVRFVMTANRFVDVSLTNMTFKMSAIEIDINGQAPTQHLHCSAVPSIGKEPVIARCLVHGGVTTDVFSRAVRLRAGGYVLNSVIYDVECSRVSSGSVLAAGIVTESTARQTNIQNTTIHDIRRTNGTGTSAAAYGVMLSSAAADDADFTIQNTIATGTTNDFVGAIVGDFANATATLSTIDHNLSSDTSAVGTGSLTIKAASDQFVSTVSGSEDLHLKAGADAIGAGTDLGTTPSGVEIDIDGSDRDALGVTWDMGAHQLLAAGGFPLVNGGFLSSPLFGGLVG